MIFTWKVQDIIQEDDVLTQVKYSVKAVDGDNSVDSEGYWTFKDKTHFLQKETTEKAFFGIGRRVSRGTFAGKTVLAREKLPHLFNTPAPAPAPAPAAPAAPAAGAALAAKPAAGAPAELP